MSTPPTRSRAPSGERWSAVITYVPEGSGSGRAATWASGTITLRTIASSSCSSTRAQPQSRRLHHDPVPRRIGATAPECAPPRRGSTSVQDRGGKRGRAPFWIDDYYTVPRRSERVHQQDAGCSRESDRQSRQPRHVRAALRNPKHIRVKKLAPAAATRTAASAAIRRSRLRRSAKPPADQDRQRRRRRGADVRPRSRPNRSHLWCGAAAVARSGRGGATAPPAGPPRPTIETAPEATLAKPDTIFIDELSGRDARRAQSGTRTVIVPAGGT